MDNTYFGEGLTLLGERLFQVAWLTNTGFTYDLRNLSKVCSALIFLILWFISYLIITDKQV